MAKAQRKKASKKDFIVLRASAMFREKGFPATSMRDLAEAVGIEAAEQVRDWLIVEDLKKKN